ncbi:hypothetical protein Glove_2g5 [Diversispora epigaea]|uniref:Uncharacterized protein n=1 Tax=Diversispora epigaea TaxID=1348612 RepID=A0A397JQM3_9GLOM|nr:hypothetical protein Glove_2g5 [Diversispora epigaea]
MTRNEKFQSKMADLIQKTQERTNLSFRPYNRNYFNTELRQEFTRNILVNGLYSITRGIKSYSIDEESSDINVRTSSTISNISNQSGSSSCMDSDYLFDNSRKDENSQMECDVESTFSINEEEDKHQDLEEKSVIGLKCSSDDDDFWQDENLSQQDSFENRTMLTSSDSLYDDNVHVVPKDNDLLDFDDEMIKDLPGCNEIDNYNIIRSQIQGNKGNKEFCMSKNSINMTL